MIQADTITQQDFDEVDTISESVKCVSIKTSFQQLGEA